MNLIIIQSLPTNINLQSVNDKDRKELVISVVLCNVGFGSWDALVNYFCTQLKAWKIGLAFIFQAFIHVFINNFYKY